MVREQSKNGFWYIDIMPLSGCVRETTNSDHTRGDESMHDSKTIAKELVVLVHGFAAKRLVMWPMAFRLKSVGFKVARWNYLSYFKSIDEHAKQLEKLLVEELRNESRIHLVAHSMGCIIVRAALLRQIPCNLGRVVLLAPPNHGSPIARIASHFLGGIVPPTRELSDSPSSYVNQLPTSSSLDVGIISAKWDILVPSQNTDLATAREQALLSETHNSLLISRSAFNKTVCFLKTGTFAAASSIP